MEEEGGWDKMEDEGGWDKMEDEGGWDKMEECLGVNGRKMFVRVDCKLEE